MDLSLTAGKKKKVLLVVLAQSFRRKSSGMLADAASLTVDLSFHYH